MKLLRCSRPSTDLWRVDQSDLESSHPTGHHGYSPAPRLTPVASSLSSFFPSEKTHETWERSSGQWEGRVWRRCCILLFIGIQKWQKGMALKSLQRCPPHPLHCSAHLHCTQCWRDWSFWEEAFHLLSHFLPAQLLSQAPIMGTPSSCFLPPCGCE